MEAYLSINTFLPTISVYRKINGMVYIFIYGADRYIHTKVNKYTHINIYSNESRGGEEAKRSNG